MATLSPTNTSHPLTKAHLLPSCGEGRIVSPDGKGCTDKNECLDSPCRNGGSCINQDPRLRYRCVCLDGFWGENCELVQEGQTLKLGMGALAAILVCLLTILSKSSLCVPLSPVQPPANPSLSLCCRVFASSPASTSSTFL